MFEFTITVPEGFELNGRKMQPVEAPKIGFPGPEEWHDVFMLFYSVKKKAWGIKVADADKAMRLLGLDPSVCQSEECPNEKAGIAILPKGVKLIRFRGEVYLQPKHSWWEFDTCELPKLFIQPGYIPVIMESKIEIIPEQEVEEL